jgi:broad specificity phosphatase PhoE
MASGGFTEVFLARHGKTEWNQAGRRQGQLDAPLTPAGRAEVERVADGLREMRGVRGVPRVRGMPIDAVFSSPLGRARTTAELYAGALGLAVVTVDELAEIHHGSMAGLTDEETDVAFPGEMSRRAADKYRWRFPDGESYAEGDVRAAAALRIVGASGAARPLLVSHAMIGRMLLRNLLDLAPDDALTYEHPHGVVYRVDMATRTLDEIRP